MEIKDSNVYKSLNDLLYKMHYTRNDISKIVWYSASDHEWYYFTQDVFYSAIRYIDDYSNKKLLDFVIYLRDGSKITHKNYSPFEISEDPSILWDYHPAEFNPKTTFKIPYSMYK